MPPDTGLEVLARALGRRPDDSRVGLAVLAIGLLAAFAIQVANPVGVPLYDGVVVQEPYRFLHPSGDEAGNPTSFQATVDVVGNVSPPVQAFTAEVPPQVQLIAQRDAFVLTPGATALEVSIAPVEAPGAPPASGEVAGNVYRISVTDQAATPLEIRPCEGCISLVLRAPQGTEEAVLERFADGAWLEVETIHAGMVALYATNPEVLGDYAVVAGADGQGGGDGDDPLNPWVVVGGAVVVLLLALAGLVAVRARRAHAVSADAHERLPDQRRTQTKRARSRRPPSGRSDR